jgi:branched-chain amino acid transport system substrate-binding protein
MRLVLCVCFMLLGSAPAWAAVPCPIRIGLVLPQSGTMASNGRSLGNGLQMGLDQINAAGGIAGCQVSFVTYDSQSVPANAATLARRLVSQDQVPIIIGSPISVESLAMLEITENAQVPLFVPSAASAKITDQGFKWVWRQSVIDISAARLMVSYIAKQLHWKKAGVIYENSDYGRPTYVNTLKPGLQAAGVQVVDEEAVNAGTPDLSSQLLRIRDAGAEGLLYWGHAKEAAILLSENQQLHIGLPIAGDTGIAYPEFLAVLPADIQGATKLWAVTQFVASTDDPKQRAWIDAYKAKFDRIADSTAIDGYDSMFVLKQVIEGAGSLTPEALQRAFGAVAYDGMGGWISFDATGQARRALEIVQLTPKDGPGWRVVTVAQPGQF